MISMRTWRMWIDIIHRRDAKSAEKKIKLCERCVSAVKPKIFLSLQHSACHGIVRQSEAGSLLFLTPDTRHLFVCTAVLVKIVSGFLNRIEGDPIPPQGGFTLPAGKLYRRVSMVFIAIVIIRVKNMFGHVFLLFFIFESNISMMVCQIRTNCWKKYKFFCERLTACLKTGLTVNVEPVEPVSPLSGKNKSKHFPL